MIKAEDVKTEIVQFFPDAAQVLVKFSHKLNPTGVTLSVDVPVTENGFANELELLRHIENYKPLVQLTRGAHINSVDIPNYLKRHIKK